MPKSLKWKFEEFKAVRKSGSSAREQVCSKLIRYLNSITVFGAGLSCFLFGFFFSIVFQIVLPKSLKLSYPPK
jgi:hypothetical protein